jgi:hypothetical protein
MKRLKFKHCYHDGLILAVRYRDNADVVIDIDLCSCCNPSPGPAILTLLGLRNFAEVRQALEPAQRANAAKGYIDEIIGIVRIDGGAYLLDLATAGAVRVEARGLHEA